MPLSRFSRIKWEHARDLRKRGDYQAAERELKEALDEEPDQPLLRSSLAHTYLRQGRLVEARVLAEGILAQDPNQSQAMYVLGEISLRENELDEALEYFRQASKRDPGTYLTLVVAKTLRELGRYQEALETLDSVLIGDQKNIRFLKEKALILNRTKQCQQALSTYEQLLELDPKDRFVRKEVYRLRGQGRQDRQMIGELETVLNLPSRKKDPQLHGLLGQKLKQAGKLEEAAAEFRIARDLDPKNTYFLKLEGFCHYRRGAYPEAIRALSEVFRKDPNDFRVRTTLKKLYTVTNDIAGFVGLLEELVTDHPHNVKLMGILKGMKKKAYGKNTEDA
jgi:tetratricopeptide (TPR) repeat protein